MNLDVDRLGYVFNIQQFSIHDGPGIRTIVFLKGCPLRCAWCSNPESQKVSPELAWSSSKCIACDHLCTGACPHQLIASGDCGEIKINRDLCGSSFACAEICPTDALSVFGKKISVAEVLREVESDSAFYRRSDGGMTLSGGEPLLQAEFAISLLKEAKRHGIRTSIETSGCVEWSTLERACRLLNTVIYDIKCRDSSKHKRHTGMNNQRILRNFEKMCREFPRLPVLIRTPIIPGFNDTVEDVLAIADFIRRFPNVKYEILPYHRLGQSKYEALDREYPLGDAELSDETFAHLRRVAKEGLELGRESSTDQENAG